MSVLDVALTLVENYRPLVVAPVAVGLLALAVSFLIPPTYTATTRILPPAQQQGASPALAAQLGTIAGLVGAGVALKNPADQYVEFLRSRTVYDAIVARFKLKELYEVKYLEDARRELARRSRASAGTRDAIITIQVDDQDPARAAAMANAFVEELRNLTKTLAISEAAQRRLFFEQQLVQSKDNLTKAQIALQRSGVAEATLRTLPQSTLETLARLKAQITAQEIKLASMRTSMTDANPEFRLALQELAALRGELAKAEKSGPSNAAHDGVEYVARYREFKYHETLFELMAKQFEVARIDEARDGAVIQVVDAALPPERKSAPRKSLIAVVAALVAFFVTVVFVFVRQAFRTTANDPTTSDKIARLRRMFHLRNV